MIHKVKAFSLVNEADIEALFLFLLLFFLVFSCFFYDPMDTGNLISGYSDFSKPSLKFVVHVPLNIAWRIVSINLLAREMSAIVQ